MRIEKNISLAPEVLEQADRLARAENKTVDELANEAVRGLIENRRDINSLRSLISENRAQAIKEGWTERSVASVVKKHRQEKSRR